MLPQQDLVNQLVADRAQAFRRAAGEERQRPRRQTRATVAAACRRLADHLDPTPARLAAR
jgi:hypothetical protein